MKPIDPFEAYDAGILAQAQASAPVRTQAQARPGAHARIHSHALRVMRKRGMLSRAASLRIAAAVLYGPLHAVDPQDATGKSDLASPQSLVPRGGLG